MALTSLHSTHIEEMLKVITHPWNESTLRESVQNIGDACCEENDAREDAEQEPFASHVSFHNAGGMKLTLKALTRRHPSVIEETFTWEKTADDTLVNTNRTIGNVYKWSGHETALTVFEDKVTSTLLFLIHHSSLMLNAALTKQLINSFQTSEQGLKVWNKYNINC